MIVMLLSSVFLRSSYDELENLSSLHSNIGSANLQDKQIVQSTFREYMGYSSDDQIESAKFMILSDSNQVMPVMEEG